MDELLGYIVIAGWIYWFATYCGNIDKGKTAYDAYVAEWAGWPNSVDLPHRFQSSLEKQEQYLDEEIKLYEQYLSKFPSPPRAPQ